MGLVSASAIIILVLTESMAQAETPQLGDRQTGKYLGNLSANPYDPNSPAIPTANTGANTAPIPSTIPMASMEAHTAMIALITPTQLTLQR